MLKEFTHLDDKNQPKMVNVGGKKITNRKATARSEMFLGEEIISLFSKDELTTKKGPVFQTAIIAGIQAVKRTSELIDHENIEIFCTVEIDGKTGVEMEALTGASVAALTVYDMCKAISQKMIIKETRLLKKTGGKSDIK